MKIQPLADKLVIKRLEEKEEQVRGGIIIPDTAKEKPQRGKVIAVGKGKLLENGTRRQPAVSEGQTVLFGKYSGSEIKIADEDFLILSEDEILAIID